VGAYAVQLGALAGLTVIATASPKNFDYVKSLGATFVFDHSGDVVSEVHNVTSGRLNYAIDAISAETAEKASKTLSSGGQLATIAGVPKNPPSHVTVYDVALSEDFSGENDVFKKVRVELYFVHQ
jgi:NADPH:quinone reductase-like Zn-dependent oxidoreductase